MTSEDFITEILANPDDDVPRLIYADWLEERGNVLGEFIRNQCEYAALTKPVVPWYGMYGEIALPYTLPDKILRSLESLPRCKALLSRQVTLLMEHSGDWVTPLGTDVTGILFVRGFVEGLATSAINYARHAERWYRLTPLRQLRLNHIGEHLGSFLGSPFACHLRVLDLQLSGRRFHNHEALCLAACPNVSNLRHLGLGYNEIGEQGVRALLESPYLKNLQSLRGITQALSDSTRTEFQARFGDES